MVEAKSRAANIILSGVEEAYILEKAAPYSPYKTMAFAPFVKNNRRHASAVRASAIE